MFVPVRSLSGNQVLMPTHPNKAGMLIKKGLATPYWSNGIFCIRLNYETQAYTQEIAVGVDPGSKKEGWTIKSESHTYLNVQADAHNKVGKKVEKRRILRRGRRSRKCPNRKQKMHNLSKSKRIPAGTRARWDWKLRILDWLSKLYPITHVCVEDIKARTIQRAKKWNQSFSPLEVGKQWFYSEIQKHWELLTLQGWETKEIRDRLGLKKSSKKMAETFIEQGERKGTIENIIALLREQCETDAVQALKPALESIDDLQNLKQLLLAVPQSNSLEAFMQSLSNRNGN